MEQQTDRFEIYRRIGPFDAANLPRGLLAEHRLKPGTWARLSLLSGQVCFVWDTPEPRSVRLDTGADLLIEPEVPHHLEPEGDFLIEIAFMRERSA